MAKILHCADMHIGAMFQSLPNKKKDIAKKMQFKALEDMVFMAKDCDLILISGDLFDKNVIDFGTAQKVFNILGSFAGKVIISPGNHDFMCDDSPYRKFKLFTNIHVFNSRAIEKLVFDDINTVVYGSAFISAGNKVDLSQIEVDNTYINIGVFHGDIGTNSIYNYQSADEISKSALDYIAFGHNHSYSGLQKAGNTMYSCSGALMATGFDEVGRTGFLMGKVEKNATSLKYYRQNLLKFNNLSLDITDFKDIIELKAKIKSLAKKNLALDLSIIGEKKFDFSLNQLTEMEKDFFALRIRDESGQFLDIWSKIKDDDIAGVLCQNMKEEYDKADENGKKIIERGIKLALTAILQ